MIGFVGPITRAFIVVGCCCCCCCFCCCCCCCCFCYHCCCCCCCCCCCLIECSFLQVSPMMPEVRTVLACWAGAGGTTTHVVEAWPTSANKQVSDWSFICVPRLFLFIPFPSIVDNYAIYSRIHPLFFVNRTDWLIYLLIYWLVFNAASAISQPSNGDLKKRFRKQFCIIIRINNHCFMADLY